MKDSLRQLSVIITIIATIAINVLANALPINGLNTGQISDRFQVYFVPAGYVFSIWGVIYLALIAHAVYQALPAQRENPRLRAAGWWVTLGGFANIAWIFLWHYGEQFPLTLVAMLGLLVTLIITYLRLGTGRTTVSTAETWAVRVPFSIYLGWITVGRQGHLRIPAIGRNDIPVRATERHGGRLIPLQHVRRPSPAAIPGALTQHPPRRSHGRG